MARRLTDADREVFDQFIAAHPFCWACGIDPNDYDAIQRERRRIDYPRWLERHHIVKSCRIHALWNLTSLCKLCHDLAEMHTVRHELEPLPYLRMEHVLWLKQHFDHENYDVESMQRYSIRRLPEPESPPKWFLDQLLWHKRFKKMHIPIYEEKS